MKNYVVSKVGSRKFSLRWLGQKDPLIMDMNPVIDENKLTGNFVLLHWQAKPKFLRTWGLYDSKSDQYYVINTNTTLPLVNAQLVDVDERFVFTVPTAMVCYQGCSYNEGLNSIHLNE